MRNVRVVMSWRMKMRIARRCLVFMIPFCMIAFIVGALIAGCEKKENTNVKDYTINACDKNWRFAQADTIYRQDRRNEVYNDAKLSNVKNIRLTAEKLKTASTNEGSAAQRKYILNISEKLRQICVANGWRQPGAMGNSRLQGSISLTGLWEMP